MWLGQTVEEKKKKKKEKRMRNEKIRWDVKREEREREGKG